LNQSNDIVNALQSLMRTFFKQPHLTINTQTTADEINEWDSLNHMNFIHEVELLFDIQFQFVEVMAFENIGQLVKSIQQKV